MNRSDATQQELDANQYNMQSILDYEQIYGQDFVSPGGKAVARELISSMALNSGARVLDAGCGLGGSSFLMVEEFALNVEGIDLSKNMLNMALEKSVKRGLTDKITLRVADCLKIEQLEHFDAIYSRDVFLHIADKKKLFSVLFQSLKAGGKLLLTDYCCGEKPWQTDFTDYVKSRGYSLHTLSDYANSVAQAGFAEIQWQDRTEQFISILESELHKISTMPTETEFLNKATIAWQEKITRARGGDQRWGLITATKP